MSVTSDEKQSNGSHGSIAALSADGRYVAFTGTSRSLGSPKCGDINDMATYCQALWVRDRLTATTTLLVSARAKRPNTQDEQGLTLNTFSYFITGAKFSADGRYISFSSDDPTLVPGDRNGVADVFVVDRLTNKLARVSVSSQGREGTVDPTTPDRLVASLGSYGASMSSNGRYVVFTSPNERLVPNDTNHYQDVFVRDRATGRTERVSVASGGRQLDGPSTSSSLQAISGDGRYVVFTSAAPNISPQPDNAPCASDACRLNVFLHDRTRKTTTLLSRSPSGKPGDASSDHPSISTGGRHVAFTSLASNLVGHDTNGVHDVFRVDLGNRRMTRVSVASNGEQQQTPPVARNVQGAFSATQRPVVSLSADGRYVAFSTAAPNLAAGDNNNALDVFIHDSRTRSTSRLSVTERGGDPDADSFEPFLSADARSVVFVSNATNLVDGDTNGTDDVFVHDSRVAGRA